MMAGRTVGIATWFGLAVLIGAPACAMVVDGEWVFRLVHRDVDDSCRLTLLADDSAMGASVVSLSATGDCGAFEGTLDRSTGDFVLAPTPNPYCTMTGTFAADGVEVSGGGTCFTGGVTGLVGARCTTEPCDYTACVDPTPCLIGSYYFRGRCVGGRPREVPVATPCDDGNACTLDDRCAGSACIGTPDPACRPAVCGCGPCETCGPNGSCVPAIRADCATPPGAIADVVLHTATAVTGWRLRARGVSSTRVPGPPEVPELCVFDGRGEVVAALAASPRCRERSCWRPTRFGTRYVDPTGRHALTGLRSWRRRDGRLLLRARGRGAEIDTLPPTFPLRVQLRSGADACWATTFAGPTPSGSRTVQAHAGD